MPTRYFGFSSIWCGKLSGAVLLPGLLLLPFVAPLTAQGQRQMENLGRGVVAVRSTSTQAFISWRLLALDPTGIGFNVYRSANGGAAVKLNSTVLTNGCNYTDTTANFTQTNSYSVRPVTNGVELAASAAWKLPPNTQVGPFFRVPIQPPSNHAPADVWVGDLDGDGEYEYVVSWYATSAGMGLTQFIQAYTRTGTLLWQVDFGPNSIDPDNIYPNAAAIIAGQCDGVAVYDFDGDGRAEVIVKSANGVTFGDGKTLAYGDNLTQFISVLDGMTGAERSRTIFPNPWKFTAGRPLGVIFGIGYADGVRPSLYIHAKNRNPSSSFNVIESAWDFRGGVLSNRWSIQWDGDVWTPVCAHGIRVVDVNGDGKDELIPGMHCVNSDGTLRWDLGAQGVVHGDRFHVTDIDPTRPGVEMYGIQQSNPSGLVEYFADASTGQLLWTNSILPTEDAGRGIAADIDPRYPGEECWSFYGVHRADTGEIISPDPTRPYPNSSCWWDGDLLRDSLDGTTVNRWNYTNGAAVRILTAYQYGATLNGGKLPFGWGDFIGDWREELIYQDTNTASPALMVFTTDQPTTNRIYTLMQNPAYRNGTAGYFQARHPDYFLGSGMSNPPTPNIVYVASNLPPAAPAAPTALSATAVSDTQINLVWNDNSTNEENFKIERSTNGVNFAEILLLTANVTNYSDIGLDFSTTYYYRIRASNLGGSSVSAIVSATTSNTTHMIKSDTATMNLAADWSGTTPAITEVGLFNNVISAGNAAALALGGDVAVGGLIFNSSLKGPVTVAAGNALTLGGTGLNMAQANQDVTLNNTITVLSNQVWNVDIGRTLTANGSVNGAGALTKSGLGTVKFAGSNSYSGGTLISAGTISLVGTNNENGLGAGPVTLNGGTLKLYTTGGSSTSAGTFSNALQVLPPNNSTLIGFGRGSLSSTLTGDGTLNYQTDYVRATVDGNWNAFAGQVNVTPGLNPPTGSTFCDFRIAVGSSSTGLNMTNGRINLADNVYMYQSSTPATSGTTHNIGELSGSAGAKIGGTGTAGRRAIWTVGWLNTDATFAGVIQDSTGPAGVTKVGSGTWILSGTNTYSGLTTINGGVLQIGDGGSAGTPGAGNITNKATFAFNRANALSDSSFGVISGSGTLIQAGDGLLLLTNAHTYSGPTIIQAGILALADNGSIANSTNIDVGPDALLDVSGRTGGGMTLAAGKVLRGQGAVKGDLTVGSGARLQPGTSIGTLTFSNALVLAAGSTNVFEVSADPLANDHINTFGALTCGGTLLVTNISSSGLVAGNSFDLFDAASFSGSFNSFSLPPLAGGLRWATQSVHTNGIISVVSLPAPTIGGVKMSGTNLVLNGTNGPFNATYFVLTSTNLALPLANWKCIATNQISANAIFGFTNAVSLGSPKGFYLLRLE